MDAVFTVNSNLPNQVFSLGVGQSKSINFGSVQLRETTIDSNETDNLGVTAYLQFDLPSVGQVQIPGDAVACVGKVSDCGTDLKIDFDPVYVDFGGCGKFKVDLTDLCFTDCGTLCVDACVTLCSAPCVPEPATIVVWSLLGATSWLGMRVWRRRGTETTGRRPWAPENREAIQGIIARGNRV